MRPVVVPRGLLFHDPLRWQLLLAPAGLEAPALSRFLLRFQLGADAALPPVRKRRTQIFWVDLDQAPEKPPFIIRDRARFACVTCGTSCSTLSLGPLFAADAERLLGLDWTSSGRDTARFFTDQQGNVLLPEEATPNRELFLRTEGKRCQFLRDDNLCTVHAQFGAQAKPVMCRLFPYHLRATPTGVVVGIRLGECMEAVRVEEGQLMAEQVADFAQMYSEHDQIGFLPPHLWLSDDQLLSWEEYLRLETHLLALPGRAGEQHTAPFAAQLLSALEERAGLLPAQPLGDEQMAKFAGEVLEPPDPLQQRALALDPAALLLEDRLCRQAVFNKDLFLHQDLVQSAALLVVKAGLSRILFGRLAGEGTAVRAMNRAWKNVVDHDLRQASTGLDLRALAARILGSGFATAKI